MPEKLKLNSPRAIPFLDNTYLEYAFLAAVCLIIIIVRIRLLPFPLDRDEGEYAYMGRLILEGISPFIEAYNMKLPGTAFMYALSMLLFGQTTTGIHLGLLVANLLTIVLFYLFVKRLCGGSCAVLAATAYALLSTGSRIYGYAAHATHFVNLFGIAGLYITSIAVEKKKWGYYFIAGIALGFAPLMKQPGAVFPLIALILSFMRCSAVKYLSRQRPSAWHVISLLAGSGIPLALLLICFSVNNAWEKFIFWTIIYAKDYVNQIPLSGAYQSFVFNVAFVSQKSLPVWILAAPGLFAGFFVKPLRESAAFIALFVLLSFISICPGFYFRPHYFVQFLPALGLMLASALYAVIYFASKHSSSTAAGLLKYGLLCLLVFYCAGRDRNCFFIESPDRLSKTFCGSITPFNESMQIAGIIKELTDKNDRVAILGSEPQILFYADRKSATGYIYTYNLMEIHKNNLAMQKEMIAEIEKAQPPVIIFVNMPNSWFMNKNSEKYIFQWYEKYIRSHNFEAVCVVEILDETAVFITGDKAKTYRPQTPHVVILKKKNGEPVINPAHDPLLL